MNKEWFLYQDKEQKGPFTDKDFKKMALNGEIKPDSLVWLEDMPEWSPAEAVEGLLPKSSSTPPPLPDNLISKQLPPIPKNPPTPGADTNNEKQAQPVNPSAEIIPPSTADRGPTANNSPNKKQGLMKIAVIAIVILSLIAAGTMFYSNYSGVKEPLSMLPDQTTDDGESYLSYRSETHTNLTSAFILFGELMKNPLYTNEWEADLQASMSAIMVICNDILSSSAPSEFRESHELFQEAAIDYFQAISSFIDLLPEQAEGYLLSGDQKYTASISLLPNSNYTGPGLGGSGTSQETGSAKVIVRNGLGNYAIYVVLCDPIYANIAINRIDNSVLLPGEFVQFIVEADELYDFQAEDENGVMYFRKDVVITEDGYYWKITLDDLR
jgi:hypothetical protein